MPEKFDDFMSSLLGELQGLTGEVLQQFQEEGFRGGQQFLNDIREDLEHWTNAVAEGSIDQEDFEWLLKSKRDLAVMQELRDKGLSHIELQQFADKLLTLTFTAAIKFFITIP